MYPEVAVEPEREFHSPTGRQAFGFVATRLVGPSGRVIGPDLTEAMRDKLCRRLPGGGPPFRQGAEPERAAEARDVSPRARAYMTWASAGGRIRAVK
jgi:hypothetical protein